MIARTLRAASLVGGVATLVIAVAITLDVLLRNLFNNPLLGAGLAAAALPRPRLALWLPRQVVPAR